MAAATKQQCDAFSRQYQLALQRYLREGAAASLASATRLGRRAASLGFGAPDVARLHDRAIVGSPGETRRAGDFLVDAIVPLEEANRLVRRANSELSQLNDTLHRRSLRLEAANRDLRDRIGRLETTGNGLREACAESGRMLDESRREHGLFRRLLRRNLVTHENERRRISEELREALAQTLAGINVRLSMLNGLSAGLPIGRGLHREILSLRRLVDLAIDSLHRFARELRPAMLDDLGLIPALQALFEDFRRQTGIRVDMTTTGEVGQLDLARRTVLFRVAEEALRHLARQARDGRVDTGLQQFPRAVCLQIRARGPGVSVKRAGREDRSRSYGLLQMRERVEMVGGEFSVASMAGRGTTIEARVPFHPMGGFGGLI